MKQRLKEILPNRVVDVLQRVRRIVVGVQAWLAHDYRMAWPPGHYYSPIVAQSYMQAHAERIFSTPDGVPGIELRETEQLSLLAELAKYYSEQPFKAKKTAGLRYYFDNETYGYGDALILYALLRHLSPARVVEVGSGFSSAVMLDTAARFLDDSVRFTFIEPYSTLVDDLSRPFGGGVQIVRQHVQDVDPSVFEALTAGDVLFIDSTHVAKPGGDVNFLLFEILPKLRQGVVVHVHDIFYPFEYPEGWIAEGRSWNEAYLLRALLMFSDRFEILLWNSYLATFHKATAEAAMPLWSLNTGGSIWLQRT